MRYVPNLITFCRIAFVPVAWGLFLQRPFGWESPLFLGWPAPYWMVWLVILSGTSDTLDGVLARRSKSMSTFGKIMDPVADKLFMTTCWIFLADLGRIHPIGVILAISRDACMGALRNLAGAEGKVISAIGTAKTKTVLQFVSIGFLVHADVLELFPWIPVSEVGQVLFYLALVLSYISLTFYLRSYLQRKEDI